LIKDRTYTVEEQNQIQMALSKSKKEKKEGNFSQKAIFKKRFSKSHI
jgi:hypothetical protein